MGSTLRPLVKAGLVLVGVCSKRTMLLGPGCREGTWGWEAGGDEIGGKKMRRRMVMMWPKRTTGHSSMTSYSLAPTHLRDTYTDPGYTHIHTHIVDPSLLHTDTARTLHKIHTLR